MRDTKLFEDSDITWRKASNEQKWEFSLAYLKSISISALNIVLSDSELKELWKESNDYDIWEKSIKEIKNRLLK